MAESGPSPWFRMEVTVELEALRYNILILINTVILRSLGKYGSPLEIRGWGLDYPAFIWSMNINLGFNWKLRADEMNSEAWIN